jgi:hypothetical protein
MPCFIHTRGTGGWHPDAPALIVTHFDAHTNVQYLASMQNDYVEGLQVECIATARGDMNIRSVPFVCVFLCVM